MAFNTFEFLVFIPLLFFLYYAVPKKNWQLTVLVLGGFVFLGWNEPWLITLLLHSICVTAICSAAIARSESKSGRFLWAFIGVTLNLCAFLVVKYWYPIVFFIGVVFQYDLWHVEPSQSLIRIGLPLGISFYALQAISLLCDTKSDTSRSDAKSIGEHFVHSAFLIGLFPYFWGGPLARAKELIPQIAAKRFKEIDWDYVVQYLILGYFLKIFVADNLGSDLIPHRIDKLIRDDVIVMMVENFLRIFAEFAGYSYIAIGLAGLFGYRLPRNFNWPLVSQSVCETCKRWNISLSRWLTDYVYIPLGGGRRGPLITARNVVLVMIVSGVWHGVQPSFVVWGAVLGLAICIERAMGLDVKRFANPFAHAVRSVALVLFLSAISLLFMFPPDVALRVFQRIWLPATAITVYFPKVPALIFMLPVLLLHIFAFLRERCPERFYIHPLVRQFALSTMLFLTIVSPGEPSRYRYFIP